MEIQVKLQLSKVTQVYDYDVTTGVVSTTFTEEDGIIFDLDLYDNEKIPITYQISDPTNANLRTTSFSKTFQIPATPTNSKAFNFPYMSSSSEAWQAGRATIEGDKYKLNVFSGLIQVDGITVFTGTLELTDVKIEGGEVTSYEVAFFASEVNLFSTYFSNRLLTQQTFVGGTAGSGLNINNTDEVVQIMAATGPGGAYTLNGATANYFTMAYPDWGFSEDIFYGQPGTCPGITGGTYNTTENTFALYWLTAPPSVRTVGLRAGYNLLPYPFVKSLLDNAFASTPFVYSSSFFETDVFKSLLLLYFDDTEVPTNTWMYRFGYNPSEFYTEAADYNNPLVFNRITSLDECSVVSTFVVEGNTRTEDIYNFWDSVEEGFVLPRDGTFTIQVKAQAVVRFGWNQTVGGAGGNACFPATPNLYPHATYPLLGANSTLRLVTAAGATAASANISNPIKIGPDVLSNPPTYVRNTQTVYQWEAVFDLATTPISLTFSGSKGDVFYLEIGYDGQNYFNAPQAAGCPPFPSNPLPFNNLRKYQQAMDLIVQDVTDNDIVWKRTVPPITETELLQQVIKLFNLQFEITPNSNLISIEPRPDFYDETQILDWTSKLDSISPRTFSRNLSSQSFESPKQLFFKYADTENFLDIERQQKDSLYGLNYGSFQTEFLNGTTVQTVDLLAGSTTPYIPYSVSSGTIFYYQFPKDGLYYNIPGLALFGKSDAGVRQQTETSKYYFAFANGLVLDPVTWANDIVGGFPLNRYPVRAYVSSVNGASILTSPTGATAAQVLSPFSNLFPGATSSPAVDLNFNPTSTVIWNWGNPVATRTGNFPSCVTNSVTLYDKYYSGFYNNLKDQIFMRASFKLTTEDIANFTFRSPVFITFPNGSSAQYLVQSISYDPTTPGSAEVILGTYNPLYIN